MKSARQDMRGKGGEDIGEVPAKRNNPPGMPFEHECCVYHDPRKGDMEHTECSSINGSNDPKRSMDRNNRVSFAEKRERHPVGRFDKNNR